MIHDVVKAKLTHILVYIPCYFEYIKIRNFMNDTMVKFVSVTEYSEPAEVRRCRKFFEEGEYPIMLLTERRHFYHRVVQETGFQESLTILKSAFQALWILINP